MMLKKVSLSRLMFFCIMTTIIVVELTFSRYKTTLSKSSDVTIALMSGDVIADIRVPEGIYPGSEPAIVSIAITNENSKGISQVSQDYKFKIFRDEQINIPFEFTLYKDMECTELINADETGYYSNTEFKFDAGQKDEHIYYLKIYWPEEYNDASYAFEIDYISLLVDVIQKD